MSTTRPGAATARYSLVLSLVLLYLPSLMAPALAFNFTTNTTAVSACGDMLVTWEGGSPPYNVTIIAEADWPGTFNLSEVFSDVELQLVDGVWYGQWTYTVAYQPGSELVMFMSDSAGIGTGGSSQIIDVGNALHSSDRCWLEKTKPQGLDWMTDTSAATQDAQSCEPLTITWSDPFSQVQPNLIIGISPPQVLQFPIDSGSASSSREIVWDVDVPAGSRVILQGYDAATGEDAIGRASSWTNITANPKDDVSCLDRSSSTTTGTDGQVTGTSTGRPVRTVTATIVVTPGSGMSVGKIVGLVFGIVAALLLAQIAFYFLCWRRRIERAESRGARGGRGEKDVRRLSRIVTTSDVDHLRYEPFPSTVEVDSSTACIPSPANSAPGHPASRRGGPFDDDADTDADVRSAMAEHDKASVRSMPMTELSGHEPHGTDMGTWRSGTATRVHTPTTTTAHAITPTRSSPLDPFGDTMATTWTLADLDDASSTTKRAAPVRPPTGRLASARLRGTRSATGTASPIYIHEDAGRVQRAQHDEAQEQEELPPRYDPDWRYETER